MTGKRTFKLIAFLFVAGCTAFFSVPGVLAEEVAGTSGNNAPIRVLTEGFESEMNSMPVGPTAPRERDPFILELRAARASGDLEAYEALQSQIPQAPTTGEGSGGTVIHPSTTVTGMGSLLEQQGGPQEEATFNPLPAGFGDDVRVSGEHYNMQTYQTMASGSDGTLYVAWQDTALAKDYIQVYSSEDLGKTWDAFGYVSNAGADLKEPCLAMGDGTIDRLLLAYIVDDGTSDPYPEVASAPVTGGFTVSSVPIWTDGEAYTKPVICTDSVYYNGWYAYLTCEWVYEEAISNINVCTWRSTDSGGTWTNDRIEFGQPDTEAWIDPDICFGTTEKNVYVSCYNDTTNKLYLKISEDDGATYPTQVEIYTIGTEPVHDVDPEIAAAINTDTVMMCCTRSSGGADCVAQGYSADAGATWTTMWVMNGTTSADEWAPALIAQEGGDSWHCAYSRGHHVLHTYRPQDLSAYWASDHDMVDDLNLVSSSYTKKGIACHWDYDVCGIAWSDYRDGTPDYDTYYDFTQTNKVYVPTEFTTIQAAINDVTGGFEVMVEPGFYEENIDFMGKPITVKSTEGAQWTILNGMQSGSVVTFDEGESFTSILEGFTIMNGDYGSGGGINCVNSDPIIRNNVIYYNFATYGAGIFCYNADPYITNNTIVENWATNGGGGMYCKSSASPTAMNNIFWNNNSTSGNDEIVVEIGSPIISYSDIDGGWPGTGNINADPQFVNSVWGDFHITWNSPCRDAGFNAASTLPETDFEGDDRKTFGQTDMGADEFAVRFYYSGKPRPGGSIYGNLVGIPGTSPVGFWVGSGVREVPYFFPAYGNFWLKPPLLFSGFLGAIPADGVMSIYVDIPASPPAPYEIPLQALIGTELSNLLILRIWDY